MAEDVVIGKARVINVGEIELTPMPSVSDPAATRKKKVVVASQLRIEPLTQAHDGFTQIHGVMTLPGALPFGTTYKLVLQEHDGNVEQPAGRQFKEEE